MIAVSLPITNSANPIRKLDPTHDLDQVADLIELCFPIHLDPDGQTYLKEIRKAARDMRLMGWLSNISTFDTSRTRGFVWDEGGRIMGNLSLIPLRKDGKRVYLIANVAVHPDQRRQGIGRRLTQQALDYLKHQGHSEVWLQVREDNPPAVDLYRLLGFKDQASRTTWRIRPRDMHAVRPHQDAEIQVRRRAAHVWSQQKQWLDETYPPQVRWNLPVDFNRFNAGWLQTLSNFFEGIRLKHWAIAIDDNLMGVITWQKSESFANNLWLALPEKLEDNVLPRGLTIVMKRLSQRHPLSIDYPAGRCEEQFVQLGFEKFRTLIWMQRTL